MSTTAAPSTSTAPAIAVMPIETFTPTEVLQLWATWQRAAALSERTVSVRVGLVRRLATLCETHPLAIGPGPIVSFLADPGLSPVTKATYAAHLRAFYSWAVKHNLVVSSPMERVPSPKRPKAAPRPIQTLQLARILEATSRRRTRMMVLLYALAGLRVHEVAKLRGRDVDRVAGMLTVTGKGNKTATVPLHPLILAEAEAAAFPTDGYWFPAYRHDGPVLPGAVGKAVGDAMARAGVPGTAHQLRHWYGTELLRSGADLRTVQELMRHESVATTQIYTQVSMTTRAAAIAALPVPQVAA